MSFISQNRYCYVQTVYTVFVYKESRKIDFCHTVFSFQYYFYSNNTIMYKRNKYVDSLKTPKYLIIQKYLNIRIANCAKNVLLRELHSFLSRYYICTWSSSMWVKSLYYCWLHFSELLLGSIFQGPWRPQSPYSLFKDMKWKEQKNMPGLICFLKKKIHYIILCRFPELIKNFLKSGHWGYKADEEKKLHPVWKLKGAAVSAN